jgi:hypothetical protein
MSDPKPFDLPSFIAFVASKDAGEEYRYTDTSNCALCQYAREVLGYSSPRAGGTCFYSTTGARAEVTIPNSVAHEIADYPETYGALLQRLKALS